MPERQRLRADHAEAVLVFESVNRAFFATSISDRGDAYVEDGIAELGHRVAEAVTGRGVATATVREPGQLVRAGRRLDVSASGYWRPR